MSNNNKVAIQQSEIQNLDKIAEQALGTLGISGSFEQTFAVADAMIQLREAITPAMMERFTKLANTKLGFMTDKNPKVWNKRENNNQGGWNKPYSEEVVKDCVIEATMRGVKTIGNQFNIISGGCYITREGYAWKLKQLEGFSDFKPSTSVPRIAQGGAIVSCEATWTYKGKQDSMKAEIACKGDEYAGSDSYIGKAERKFFKRIYERVTGSADPDGEADTDTAQLSAPASEAPSLPRFGTGGAPTAPTKPPEATAKTPPASSPDEAAEAHAGLAPVSDVPAGATPLRVLTVFDESTPQGSLAAFMTDAGVTFESFRKWAGDTERLPDADSFATWDELPNAFCTSLQKDAKSMSKCVTRCKS
jgi:hypothetical protein